MTTQNLLLPSSSVSTVRRNLERILLWFGHLQEHDGHGGRILQRIAFMYYLVFSDVEIREIKLADC